MMDELYQYMKDSLKFFDLHFGQMDLIKVIVDAGTITFEYEKNRTSSSIFRREENEEKHSNM